MSSFKSYFEKDEPKSIEDLFNNLKLLRDSSYEKYILIAGVSDYQGSFFIEYKNRLKEYIDEKEAQAIRINDELSLT